MSLTESSSADIARIASEASRRLGALSNNARNEALTALFEALTRNKEAILEANRRDIVAASSGSITSSSLKRLDLSRQGKYDDMLQGVLSVRDLDDPGMSNEGGYHPYACTCLLTIAN